MEAILERKKTTWKAPNRKLTDEEIQELIDNFDYDAYLEELDEDADPEPVHDMYGNLTRDTIASIYEDMHGICTPVSIEEIKAWADSLE